MDHIIIIIVNSKYVRKCAQFERYYPVHRGQVEGVELTYFCLITCTKCTYVVDSLVKRPAQSCVAEDN